MLTLFRQFSQKYPRFKDFISNSIMVSAGVGFAGYITSHIKNPKERELAFRYFLDGSGYKRALREASREQPFSNHNYKEPSQARQNSSKNKLN